MKKQMNHLLTTVIIGIYVLAVWHGFTIEIGKPGKGFHIQLEQYALKRFFKK